MKTFAYWLPCLTLVLADKVQHLQLSQKGRDASRYPPPTRRDRYLQVEEDSFDGIYRGYGIHYVDLFVGCPAQTQTVIVDTGSTDAGFPCSGCDSYSCGQAYHLNSFYEEQNSTCFSSIPCDNCEIGYSKCGKHHCSVGASYVEGSSWRGYEAEDLVSAGGLDEERFLFRFACQTELTGLFRTQLADGILGMAKGNGAYWKQMYDQGLINRQAFALCQNLQEDVQMPAGVMVLGGSDRNLHETPMVYAQGTSTWGALYELKLKQIYLRSGGGIRIKAVGDDVKVQSIGMEKDRYPIADSGTTCTYLNRNLRKPFLEAWREMTDHPFLSYLAISKEELEELPTIIFQLEGTNSQDNPSASAMAGELDPENPQDILVAFPPTRYLEKSGQGYRFCFYINEFDDGVLGNNVMAGHDVLHDNDNSRIGFAESSCDYSLVKAIEKDESAADPEHSPMNPPPPSPESPLVIRPEEEEGEGASPIQTKEEETAEETSDAESTRARVHHRIIVWMCVVLGAFCF